MIVRRHHVRADGPVYKVYRSQRSGSLASDTRVRLCATGEISISIIESSDPGVPRGARYVPVRDYYRLSSLFFFFLNRGCRENIQWPDCDRETRASINADRDKMMRREAGLFDVSQFHRITLLGDYFCCVMYLLPFGVIRFLWIFISFILDENSSGCIYC